MRVAAKATPSSLRPMPGARRLHPLWRALLPCLGALPGCVVGVQAPPTQAEASAGPPAPPPETPAAAPDVGTPPAARRWVDGYWHYDGVRYVWIAGRWQDAAPRYGWSAE
jgi:YXWGXW repeat-containing protein